MDQDLNGQSSSSSSLRQVPLQVLAGQFERLLQRRSQDTSKVRSVARCESSSAPEKLPPSSPYVGFKRHAPPASPALCFSATSSYAPMLPPSFELSESDSDVESLLDFMNPAACWHLPGFLPEEVWSLVTSLIIDLEVVPVLMRVARGFQKVIHSESTWRDRVIHLSPSSLPLFAPQLDRWLPAWRYVRKMVLPRSSQLIAEVSKRLPTNVVLEVAWRFDEHLKGRGVEVIHQGRSVRRVADEELVVLGDAPLVSLGRYPYLEVRIDEIGEALDDEDPNDFGFGVTASDPQEIGELGTVADEVPRSWVVDFTQTTVCLSVNNREAVRGEQLTATCLKEGTRIGLLVKPDAFEVYIDGMLRETLTSACAEDHVPSGIGLFPVLDLYGRAIQISRTDAEEPCA